MSNSDPSPPTPSDPQRPHGEAVPKKKPLDPARVEQLTGQLKSAVRRRRPWRAAVLLALLLLFGLPIALAVWSFWPKGPPPELEIYVFDQIVGPVPAAVTVRGQLAVAGDGPVHFPDFAVFVEHERVPSVANQANTREVSPDEDGTVVLPWPEPLPEGVATFKMRHVNAERTKRWEGGAQIWVVPGNAKVLLVDVLTLTARAEEFRKADQLRGFQGVEAARNVLVQAQRAGRIIVYSTGLEDRAGRYFRVRGWVREQQFPEGPVLFQSGAGSTKEERKALDRNAKDLERRFAGVTVVSGEQDWEALAKKLVGKE